MKPALGTYISWLLLITAFGFYGYVMVAVITASLQEGPGKITLPPEDLLAAAGTMQTLMLANFGALLGISIARPDSPVARSLLMSGPATIEKVPTDPFSMRDKIQVFASMIFLLSLIACFIAWIFQKKGSTPTPLVTESGKMFIGVVLAYITALFSKGQQSEQPPAS